MACRVLNVLDLQRLIRSMPKVVIAAVAGYAIGGGHVLHVVCDLTIAADNARFGQTGPRVGSLRRRLGSSYLSAHRGPEEGAGRSGTCASSTTRTKRLRLGLVNKVVPVADLEATAVAWGRRILTHSPLAIRCLKGRRSTPSSTGRPASRNSPDTPRSSST